MPNLPQKIIFGCKLVEQSQKRHEKASSRCPPGLVKVMNLNLGEPHPSSPPALGTCPPCCRVHGERTGETGCPPPRGLPLPRSIMIHGWIPSRGREPAMPLSSLWKQTTEN